MSEPQEYELVYLTAVQTSGEAEIARLALEAQGIDCQIVGESQAGLAGVLPIKIYVRSTDLDRAKAIAEQTPSDGEETRRQ